MEYKLNNAKKEEIEEHLNLCNDNFINYLDTYVNIDEYSKKLREKSITFEAWDNNKIIGLIACYFNDTKRNKGYISNVSVISEYQKKGIAKKLLENTIKYAEEKKYKTILLEVEQENDVAINLYKKFGFAEKEQNGSKVQMEKEIKKNTVSICCITYNHVKFIKQTLDGFLMQKTNFNFEVVIHDDASTDGTTDIIKEYENQYPEILKPIYQSENQYSKGVSISVTYNFPRAKGKYIAICEGDDYWTDPYKLQKQVDFLEANPDYVITYHNADIIDENNNIVSNSKLPKDLQKDFTIDELIKGKMILTLTMCFRNVIKEFPHEFINVKNGDKFLTSLLGNYGKGKYLPEIKNAVYRKHSNSIWSSLDKTKQIFYNGDTRAWLSRYYNRHGNIKYANYFKSEVKKHFETLMNEQIKEYEETNNSFIEKIKNEYHDILTDSDIKKIFLPLNRVDKSITIEQAEQLISENKLDEAEKILLELNRRDAQNIDVLNDLSVVAIMKEDIPSGLNYISQVLEIDTRNEIALENLKYIEENFDLDNLASHQVVPNNAVNYNVLEQILKKVGWENKNELYQKNFEYFREFKRVENPTISIIVISWRLHRDNVKNFQILEQQREQNFELIFVNNGADETEFKELEPYIDKYVKLNNNTGAYLARNIGSAFAEAPILFFLEDDGIPEKNIVQAHLDTHNKYDVIAARGVYIPKTNNEFNKIAQHYYLGNKPFPFYADLEGNTSYKADIFYKVGGWDDEIQFGGGGVDLCIRLNNIEPDKRKQIYTPEPIIYHDYVKDEKHYNLKIEKQKKSRERLLSKHPYWGPFFGSWNKFYGKSEYLLLKNNFPKVSVLMTTFNRSETLANSIQSVINQTFQDWHLIIVNDGGEEVADIIKCFDDPRIKYYNIEHKGKSAALNYAIKNSNSKYVAYLDDDDEYYPNHLEVLVNYLETHKEYKFAYTISEEVTLVEKNYQWQKVRKQIIFAEQVSGVQLKYKNFIPNLCALHERSLFDEAGLYDESLDVLIDWDMYRRITQFIQPKFVNVVTSKYHKKKSFDSEAKDQLTGLINKDELKYYKHRFKILNKNLNVEKISEKVSIVYEVKNAKENYELIYNKYLELKKNSNEYYLMLAIPENFSKKDVPLFIELEKHVCFFVYKSKAKNKNIRVKEYFEKSLTEKNVFINNLNELDYGNLSLKNVEPIKNYTESKNNSGSISKIDVSVIIPTFNKIDLTKKCIDSIYSVNNKSNFEVIIIDNKSTDGTRKYLKESKKSLQNFNVILNSKNLGFSKANNQGAKRAKGEYLLFLNNDTEVTENWLDELLNVIKNDENVGIVGAKLLYPRTNTIQHAGVVIDDKPHPIFPYHIYHNKPNDFPEANLLKEYQVVTGACMLIEKNLFNKVGRFDENYKNGYEDVDLCFKVRELEIKIIYCPTAVVYHHESQTEGRFNFVEHNVKLLHDKWQNKIQKDEINEMSNLYNFQKLKKENQVFEVNEQKLVSIITLTYNQLKYTKFFVDSVFENTKYPFELIVVDNASNQDTVNYLRELEQKENVKVIYNQENLGFPKAVNQGILASNGDYVLIANNDIVVTKNWLTRMVQIADLNSQVGLVGPISNAVSGVQIDKKATYKTIPEMHNYAGKVAREKINQVTEFPRIAFLCTLIKKEVIEKLGGLDEVFTPGNFEDDDFCLRAQLSGYKAYIAEDVFIHHFGSVSFTANGNEKYIERLKINEQKFVKKWGANIEDIWIRGAKVNQRKLEYPIDQDIFVQSLKRAFINLDDNEQDLALENLKTALNNFDNSERKGYEALTKEELLNLTGSLALAKNDLEVAREYFEQQLNANPSSSQACYGLGEIFNKAELYEESKTMFEWAVANDENNEEAKQRLTEVNSKLNLPGNHNTVLEEMGKQTQS